jgi:hypothetical protein
VVIDMARRKSSDGHPPKKSRRTTSTQPDRSTKLLAGDSDLMRGWAMDPDRAHAHGVHSVESRDDLAALDLDEKTIDFWARYVPGIVYPYRLNGRTVWQYAPHKRDEHRYLVPKGAEIPLDCLRDDGQGPILLVEGTKQHHAADAWTPPEYAVYGMLGCWGWTKTDLKKFASSSDRHERPSPATRLLWGRAVSGCHPECGSCPAPTTPANRAEQPGGPAPSL